MGKEVYYQIHCSTLGDVICATPTIRKLHQVYGQKINVINNNFAALHNNPRIKNLIKHEDFSPENLSSSDEWFQSYVLAGQKNQFGIEKKFNTIDIRLLHSLDLGFGLMPEEMTCEFFPSEYNNPFNLPDNYVVLHTAKNWPNRTWPRENWQQLINYLSYRKIYTVLIGKETEEKDFHHIKKDFYNFDNLYGQNIINKDTLDLCWHILNNAKMLITLDTGPMHLAGTTDVFILQLGSAKDPRLSAPYRFGSQDFKYKHLKGPCDLYCSNNVKYSVKEWGTINAVPPLPNCLEEKPSFECQPSVDQVIQFLDKKI